MYCAIAPITVTEGCKSDKQRKVVRGFQQNNDLYKFQHKWVIQIHILIDCGPIVCEIPELYCV